MFSYIWPLGLIILSNVFYHICTKSVSPKMDPFASLTVTYLIAAGFSTLFYFVFNKGGNILGECKHINWAVVVLGICIIGLELGNICAYKAGWQISISSIVASAVLAIILIFVGFAFYKEAITLNKVIGIVICLVGLVFINK